MTKIIKKTTIHNFNIDDIMTESFKKGLAEKNIFCLYLHKMFDINTYINKELLSKFYKIENNEKSSLSFVYDPEFISLIQKSKTDCILKNRLLLPKIKKEYFVEDNLNFIDIDYNAAKQNSDSIFTATSYKDFEKFAKMMRNLAVINTVLKGKETIETLYSCDTSWYNYRYYNSLYYNDQVNKSNVNDKLTNDRKYLTIIEEVLNKISEIYDLGSIAKDGTYNSIGITDNTFNKVRNNRGVILPFAQSMTNVGNSSFQNSNRVLNFIDMIDSIRSDYTQYVKTVQILVSNDVYNINTVINKIFECSDFLIKKLDILSYTKTVSKTNPVSGFVYETNTRIAYDEANQEEVDVLLKKVNKISKFQQELSNLVTIKLKEIGKKETYEFKEVKGDEITYYYNSATYKDEGYTAGLLNNIKRNCSTIDTVPNQTRRPGKGGTLFNSCMRWPECKSKIDWYAKNPQCSMLILASKDGTNIIGRAIVWNSEGKKYVDRFFYNSNEAEIEFAKYINESDIIPIYPYNGISPTKDSQQRAWRNNRKISFEPNNIRLFGPKPYFDTMGGTYLIYNPKTKVFEGSDNEIRNKTFMTVSGSIASDCNRVKCSICGANYPQRNMTKIKIGTDIQHVCNSHIYKINSISKNKYVLIHNGVLRNVEGEFYRINGYKVYKVDNKGIKKFKGVVDYKFFDKTANHENYVQLRNWLKPIFDSNKTSEFDRSDIKAPKIFMTSQFEKYHEKRSTEHTDTFYIKYTNIKDLIKAVSKKERAKGLYLNLTASILSDLTSLNYKIREAVDNKNTNEFKYSGELLCKAKVYNKLSQNQSLERKLRSGVDFKNCGSNSLKEYIDSNLNYKVDGIKEVTTNSYFDLGVNMNNLLKEVIIDDDGKITYKKGTALANTPYFRHENYHFYIYDSELFDFNFELIEKALSEGIISENWLKNFRKSVSLYEQLKEIANKEEDVYYENITVSEYKLKEAQKENMKKAITHKADEIYKWNIVRSNVEFPTPRTRRIYGTGGGVMNSTIQSEIREINMDDMYRAIQQLRNVG